MPYDLLCPVHHVADHATDHVEPDLSADGVANHLCTDHRRTNVATDVSSDHVKPDPSPDSGPDPGPDTDSDPESDDRTHQESERGANAAGGKAGFPLTISTMQLGVGVLYSIFAWAAPEMRTVPSVTMDDIVSMIPVSFCAAAAHSFSVFAQSAGAVSFAMIVKAAEPAFAAIVGTLFYGKTISSTKWAMLVPVIGGVILASVKELDFAWSAPHPHYALTLITPSPQP